MHHYTRFLGAVFIAGLLAACSGGGGTGGAIPTTDAQPPITPGDVSPQQTVSPDATISTQATTSTITYKGTITGIETGGVFVLLVDGPAGHIPVHTSSTTAFNTTKAPYKAGSFAVVSGTGTVSDFQAQSVTLYASATEAASVSTTTSSSGYQGTISGMVSSSEFILDTTSGAGHVPVYRSSTTRIDTSRAPFTTGRYAVVTGSGTSSHFDATSITMYASAPTSTSTATPTATIATAGVPKHVLTGDYFGTPWGTTTVAASRAVPYLNWVRTGIANANAYHAAGLKVQIYSNPNRVQTTDPLYRTTASSGYAATCSGSRVYDKYKTITQYVTKPGSTALKSSYGSLIANTLAQGHVDAIFEDNAGPLEDFGVTFYASMPCSYSDSTWISGEVATEDSLPVGTIINGLSAFHDHGVSQSIAIVRDASKSLGGEIEHCFSDDSRAEQGSWPWTASENTQLQVTAIHKLFQCQAVNTYAASTETAARIYTLASFEMTYNPSYSVLWEEFGTPSGLHVMPESQFVALNPAVSVSSISQLKQAVGSYVRVYNACYYAGRLIGKCAMAVNPDYYAHGVSLAGFHHTLKLIGSGILDGGTVSFDGPAPPSTLAATSAVIALP